MENTKQYLSADLPLTIPGLRQEFSIYREQFGRVTSMFHKGGYLSTYEAVYKSRRRWNGEDPGVRAITKLIFRSYAQEQERPADVAQILAAIPGDMLEFLVKTLNDRWAVVTISCYMGEISYTINFDKCELWEQEESNSNAILAAMNRECRALGPYKIVKDGEAYRVPGSSTEGFPVPHVGVFWVIDGEIRSVKEPWEAGREPSPECFDHRACWEKLPLEVTLGKPFDHYPRGHVEIRNGEVTVFSHRTLIYDPYPMQIAREFEIPIYPTRFLAYGYHKAYIDRVY